MTERSFDRIASIDKGTRGSAGAEMLADKEKAAENTLCILKGFDAV